MPPPKDTFDPFLGPALTYARGIGVPEEELEGLKTANEVYEVARQHIQGKKTAQFNKARAKRTHSK